MVTTKVCLEDSQILHDLYGLSNGESIHDSGSLLTYTSQLKGVFTKMNIHELGYKR
jgi:hypothetical protein